MKNKYSILAILIAICCACSHSGVKPVPIQPEDMCSYCRMAISAKQFAAELITNDEKIYKFDDTGCMLNFIEKESPKIQAIYVADFYSDEWIAAKQAHFVATDAVSTPMGGGFLAFANTDDAGNAAYKFKGRLLKFTQLKQR
jgi:copper chaperone NosL